jgi:hypothetical protein
VVSMSSMTAVYNDCDLIDLTIGDLGCEGGSGPGMQQDSGMGSGEEDGSGWDDGDWSDDDDEEDTSSRGDWIGM